jgi:hypothetical protein
MNDNELIIENERLASEERERRRQHFTYRFWAVCGALAFCWLCVHMSRCETVGHRDRANACEERMERLLDQRIDCAIDTPDRQP